MKQVKSLSILAIVLVILMACASKKTVTNPSVTEPETTIEKLDEDQLKKLVSQLEQRDNEANGLMLLRAPEYFVSNAPKLAVDEMESFVELLQRSKQGNDAIMELCKRADVSIDGGVEAAINMYSNRPERTIENLKSRRENDNNYSLLISTFQKQIEINKEKEYTIPEGDLVYYSHRSFGGMLRGTHYEIQKNGNGETFLTTNANFRDMRDTTFVVPDTALVHIKKIIVDYKMYELAPLYVTPFLVYDAPSTSISATFSCGQRINSEGQQAAPHNKGVWIISDYLSSLLPTRE